MYGTIESSSSSSSSEREPLAAWRKNGRNQEEDDSEHNRFQNEDAKHSVDGNKKESTLVVGSGSTNHATDERQTPAGIPFSALTWVLVMLLLGLLGYASLPKTTGDKNNNIRADNHADAVTNNGKVSLPSSNNLMGTALQIENLDTGLKIFPWKLQKDKKTGQEYYLGYLEFCGNQSSGIYTYRTAQSATNVDPPEECGKDPAPVIRILPRTNYRLILINTSDEATNIHIHNMHLSGVGIVDDVTRQGYPGSCLVYEWYIRDNADVGSFWYHPHLHPFVSHQAGGGAFGFFIVDETDDALDSFYPKHLRAFLKKKEVLLQFLSITGKYTPTGERINRVNGRTSQADNDDPMTITLLEQDYYYFRVSSVVVTDHDNFVEFSPQGACETHAVAYDGVYRSIIPAEARPIHHVTVSSRVDLAVKCNQDAMLRFHQGVVTAKDSVVKIHVIPQQLEMESSSSPFWDPFLRTQWNPRRAYYNPNLLEGKVDETWDVFMMQTKEKIVNKTTGSIIGKKNLVSVNNHTWDPSNAIRAFEMNKLVEWNVYDSLTHPFHPHIDRMMVATPGGCGGRYEEGQYFDTINSVEPCKVRVQFWDFGGRLVLHCHNLKHEDLGMQVWLDITEGPGHGVHAAPAVQCVELE